MISFPRDASRDLSCVSFLNVFQTHVITKRDRSALADYLLLFRAWIFLFHSRISKTLFKVQIRPINFKYYLHAFPSFFSFYTCLFRFWYLLIFQCACKPLQILFYIYSKVLRKVIKTRLHGHFNTLSSDIRT
jgi:hypothetical protein